MKTNYQSKCDINYQSTPACVWLTAQRSAVHVHALVVDDRCRHSTVVHYSVEINSMLTVHLFVLFCFGRSGRLEQSAGIINYYCTRSITPTMISCPRATTTPSAVDSIPWLAELQSLLMGASAIQWVRPSTYVAPPCPCVLPIQHSLSADSGCWPAAKVLEVGWSVAMIIFEASLNERWRCVVWKQWRRVAPLPLLGWAPAAPPPAWPLQPATVPQPKT